MSIRLNKAIAELGLASRRAADALIEAGRVTINGHKAKLGQKVDLSQDEIKVAGKKVSQRSKESLEYWMLNKPVQVVSTVVDPEGRRTVAKYLSGKTKARLYPVGRLDYDSEGLLIMTNDGELAYRLTHPKYEIPKSYLAWVNGIYTSEKLERLRRGVYLREGKTAFDAVEVVEKTGRDFCLQISIHEGKKREIRRVCAKVGWEVQRLQRVQLGNLQLGELGLGQARKLTPQEVKVLQDLVDKSV